MREVGSAAYLEMISVLGHELRRPLTVIRGAATLLLQSAGELPKDSVATLLGLIDSHTLSMSDLIEDLLTVCHLDAGDVQLFSGAVEVTAIVQPVVESIRKTDPRPILVLGSAPGLEVEADPNRAGQVLRALLGNAIRFSPPDSEVEISIRADARKVRFEVLDRGPGIPVAQREAVFERFRRLDERGAGIGVGLHLARGLVRLMGGEIGIQKRPGGGSIVWFTLKRRG